MMPRLLCFNGESSNLWRSLKLKDLPNKSAAGLINVSGCIISMLTQGIRVKHEQGKSH